MTELVKRPARALSQSQRVAFRLSWSVCVLASVMAILFGASSLFFGFRGRGITRHGALAGIRR